MRITLKHIMALLSLVVLFWFGAYSLRSYILQSRLRERLSAMTMLSRACNELRKKGATNPTLDEIVAQWEQSGAEPLIRSVRTAEGKNRYHLVYQGGEQPWRDHDGDPILLIEINEFEGGIIVWSTVMLTVKFYPTSLLSKDPINVMPYYISKHVNP